MMGSWGTGVLPPPIQKGQSWVGVGKQSNCPPFHVSTALVPDLVPTIIPIGKWHFSEFPPKPPTFCMDEALAVLSWGFTVPECTLSDAPQSRSQTQTSPPSPTQTVPFLEHQAIFVCLPRAKSLTPISQSWGVKREKGPRSYESPCRSASQNLATNWISAHHHDN